LAVEKSGAAGGCPPHRLTARSRSCGTSCAARATSGSCCPVRLLAAWATSRNTALANLVEFSIRHRAAPERGPRPDLGPRGPRARGSSGWSGPNPAGGAKSRWSPRRTRSWRAVPAPALTARGSCSARGGGARSVRRGRTRSRPRGSATPLAGSAAHVRVVGDPARRDPARAAEALGTRDTDHDDAVCAPDPGTPALGGRRSVAWKACARRRAVRMP
jgi:hypothetical protein